MTFRPIFHGLLAIVTTATATAGTPMADDNSTPASTFVPTAIVSFRSSYTFESDFERGDDASGDAWFNGASVAQRFPLGWSWPSQPGAGWFVRLGAEYGRFDFNNSGGLPLPDTLQNVNAVIALEYLVGSEVAILFESAPGFYFENDLDSDSFDAPTKLAIAFPLTPRFFLIAGATYRGGFEKYPVLPILGALWRINDEWTLRLIPPAPRLVYRPMDRLRLWIGGEFTGGSYRTDDDDARNANLRNAALAYSEIKVGAGFTWGDPDRAALDIGAGYTFRRKFDYHRAEEGYETDEGAPYVRVSFSAGF
jgi:hypothetical protein